MFPLSKCIIDHLLYTECWEIYIYIISFSPHSNHIRIIVNVSPLQMSKLKLGETKQFTQGPHQVIKMDFNLGLPLSTFLIYTILPTHCMTGCIMY